VKSGRRIWLADLLEIQGVVIREHFADFVAAIRVQLTEPP
jgi:hypothetical protein